MVAHRAVFSLLALFSVAAGGAVHVPRCNAQDRTESPGQGEWSERSLRVGTLERWFRIYEPKSLPAQAPAVLLLHGGTQSMRKLFSPRAGGTRAWPAIADREKLLLIVPNGVNPENGDTRGDSQNWNDLRSSGSDHESTADDVTFLGMLLDECLRRHKLDPRRIYVTGASNGGMMTYRLLIETPERFAAAATFIASLPADLPQTTRPALPTPVLIANGTQDPLVKWEGGLVRGQPGKLMSAPANRDWWIAANRADRERGVERALPDTSPDDGCRLYETLYPAGPEGAPVLFLRMEGSGHALPSLAHKLPDTVLIRRLIGPRCRDLEGAELAWKFLSQHQRTPSAGARDGANKPPAKK